MAHHDSHGLAHHALSSTSAGVLGLLSVRAWSAYELAKQSRRSLWFAMPRAESVIYAEPKRLVQAGLATVTRERVGRRTRQVYEITPAGRAALADWLTTAPSEPALDIEPLMRVLFADAGTTADLRAALEYLDRWAAERHEAGVAICRGYLDGEAPFPERLHLSALFAGFYARLYDSTRAWVSEATAEVDTWESTNRVGLTPGTRIMLERIVKPASVDGP